MDDTKGHIKDGTQIKTRQIGADDSNFVLEKTIFKNIFDKDIQKIYIYKKTERLAKAVHLVSPAFKDNRALRDRLERISVSLMDAATPSAFSRDAISQELLTLSSILSIARTSGILSVMNADLIAQESHILLQEVAGYEEPRVTLDEAPTIATLARAGAMQSSRASVPRISAPRTATPAMSTSNPVEADKGHVKDISSGSSRREAIISILKSKGPSYIKDVSNLIRDVSEKTIQRELQALTLEGLVTKAGDRRWTRYSLVS